jgi:hypothetical protein
MSQIESLRCVVDLIRSGDSGNAAGASAVSGWNVPAIVRSGRKREPLPEAMPL